MDAGILLICQSGNPSHPSELSPSCYYNIDPPPQKKKKKKKNCAGNFSLKRCLKSLSFFLLLCCRVFDIVVNSFDDPKNLTSNLQFALLELAGSHYAAICIEGDRTTGGDNLSIF